MLHTTRAGGYVTLNGPHSGLFSVPSDEVLGNESIKLIIINGVQGVVTGGGVLEEGAAAGLSSSSMSTIAVGGVIDTSCTGL